MILSVLSSLAFVSGLMVVRAKNPVHSVYYPGRHRITDLAEFAGLLERAVTIEIHIEAALVFDGYDPDRIRGRINEIRGILFTHPTGAPLLSEQTLDRYLNEIETNGTRQSAPYMRVVRAIRN